MTRPKAASRALDRVQIGGLGDSLAELGQQAREAEAAGIDCVWSVELFRSSITQAMWLAAGTESIGVGTGIAWAFTRSPMIIALSALDLDEASGGRFRLGLGAGSSASTRPGTERSTAGRRRTCARRSRRCA